MLPGERGREGSATITRSLLPRAGLRAREGRCSRARSLDEGFARRTRGERLAALGPPRAQPGSHRALQLGPVRYARGSTSSTGSWSWPSLRRMRRCAMALQKAGRPAVEVRGLPLRM